MAVTVAQLIADLPDFLEFVSGDKEQKVTQVCAYTTLVEGGIIFTHNEESLKAALDSPVSVIVVAENSLPTNSNGKTILKSSQVKVAMAYTIQNHFAVTDQWGAFDNEAIHPTAVVSNTAQIGAGTIIGPNAVISAHCEVGENCFIGANSTLEPRVKVGAHSQIHPNVFVARDCEVGARCEIQSFTSIGSDGFGYATDKNGKHQRIPHLGKVILEDDVHLGNAVNVDRGTFDDTRIKSGTRIDNHGHIGHNNTIGKDCLIVAGLISAGSVTVGDNCIIGGRVCINGHIELSSGVMVGPMSGVAGAIREPGAYAGYPIQKMKDSMKTNASLASLPRLRKTVAKLAKKIGLDE